MKNNDIFVDKLTKLSNYIKFMTEDFEAVFGNRGCMVVIKVKPMRKINSIYGFDMGDALLKFVSNKIKNVENRYPSYKNEGNGFIIVLNDNKIDLANEIVKDIENEFLKYKDEVNVPEAYLLINAFIYDKPITSIEDYYFFLHHQYKKKFEDSSDEQILRFILSTISARVKESVSSYIETMQFALNDDVSDLPNSKSARLFLDNIESYCKEYSILFIDGDSLREFNQISYDEGNKAIRKLGEVIQNTVRKTDKVFRWLSGDEFIVISQVGTISEINTLAERIRQNIESEGKGMLFPITASIGIATFPINGIDSNDVLIRAELANKKAKLIGKNKVVIYSDDLCNNNNVI